MTPEIAVDPATNSLIVMAPSPLLDEILKLIDSLDQAAEENPARNIKIIALQKTNAKRVEDALQRILKSGSPAPPPHPLTSPSRMPPACLGDRSVSRYPPARFRNAPGSSGGSFRFPLPARPVPQCPRLVRGIVPFPATRPPVPRMPPARPGDRSVSRYPPARFPNAPGLSGGSFRFPLPARPVPRMPPARQGDRSVSRYPPAPRREIFLPPLAKSVHIGTLLFMCRVIHVPFPGGRYDRHTVSRCVPRLPQSRSPRRSPGCWIRSAPPHRLAVTVPTRRTPLSTWIRRFILFHDKRHPAQLAEPEVVRFLSHLAVEEHVSPSMQTQARAALVFLYRHVLDRPLGSLDGVVRAKRIEAPVRPRHRPSGASQLPTSNPAH